MLGCREVLVCGRRKEKAVEDIHEENKIISLFALPSIFYTHLHFGQFAFSILLFVLNIVAEIPPGYARRVKSYR